jgi:hypothetical protein
MSHWFSNRGKLLIAQGSWDDAGASVLRVGLLHGASIPTGIDTEAEIQDFNTVGDLLGVASVDEPTGTWYTGAANAGRLALVRSAATEDDTNNRVNMDAGNLVWTAAGTPDTNIYGAFVSDATTDTNDTTRLFVSLILFASVVALNGSDLTLTITDLYRAV